MADETRFGCGQEIDDHRWKRTIRDGVVLSIRCVRCRLIPMDLLMRREWVSNELPDREVDATEHLQFGVY